jgi:hypothetical protein
MPRNTDHARIGQDRGRECAEKDQAVDGEQQHERHQEPDQEFARRAGVFEAVAGDLGVAPQKAPHIRGEPEPVDPECQQQEHGPARQQTQKGAVTPEKPADARRGWQR